MVESYNIEVSISQFLVIDSISIEFIRRVGQYPSKENWVDIKFFLNFIANSRGWETVIILFVVWLRSSFSYGIFGYAYSFSKIFLADLVFFKNVFYKKLFK